MIWFCTGPFLYLAAAAFAAGATARVIAWARMPRHLRWELYPLPHLGKEGSKYQQLDFATLPRHVSRVREIVFMAEEILFLKKVFLGRRDLWAGSLLLHAGLYLGIALLGLLAAGALCLEVPRLLVGATAVCGALSVWAGLAGTVYLLVLRLADRGLRDMSDRVTFANLLLLGALFGCGLLYWLADPGFADVRTHLGSLLRGRPGTVQSPALAATLVLLGLFAAYLPLSRMFHAAAKYFFYHRILWDDEALRRGSGMERDITGYLADRVTWPAAHIRQNASWGEQLESEDRGKGAADES